MSSCSVSAAAVPLVPGAGVCVERGGGAVCRLGGQLRDGAGGGRVGRLEADALAEGGVALRLEAPEMRMRCRQYQYRSICGSGYSTGAW